MAMPVLTIDSITYNLPCSITRTATVKSSDLSGDLLDGSYYNDVIGTYLQYDVSIAVPTGMEAVYADLFEVLSSPVSEHTVTLPYNQTTKTFKCKIETISDKFYRREGTTNIWRGITFTCTGTEPIKQPSSMIFGVTSSTSITPEGTP